MKRLFVAVCVAQTLVQFAAAQEWEWQRGFPLTQNFNHVTTVGDSTVIAVGEHGTIVRSTNGGQTWQLQTSTEPSTLWYVLFRDANRAWAVGESGTVLRTEDAGVTWRVSRVSNAQTFEALAFLSDSVAWVAGQNGLRRTTNGGDTWGNPLFESQRFYAIGFIDSLRGSAVGSTWDGACKRTTDGGQTWLSCTIPSTVNEIVFVNDSLGYGAGPDGIVRTTDAGASWRHHDSGSGWLYDITFTGPERGFAVGRNGRIVRSADGGATWQATVFENLGYLRGVAFADRNRGWVVGDAGAILQTADGGDSWRVLNEPLSDDLYSIDFTGRGFCGWAVGARGTILHTADGGQLWTPQATSSNTVLRDVAALSETVAWAVGDYGKILRTTDGGGSWSVHVTTGVYLNSVAFSAPQRGWATGAAGTLFVTADGGQTWESRTTPAAFFLNDVSFSDALHGCVIGDEGTVLVTADGGETWDLIPVATGQMLLGAATRPGGRWWVVGDSGTILHSPDFGRNWSVQTTATTARLYAVEFGSDLEGWAAGASGALLHTTDGGATWESGESQTQLNLYDITFAQDGRYGWIVCQHGAVMHYGGAVAVDEPERTGGVPAGYALTAYPNPFNPRATITLELPAAGRTTLRVYDVTGRLVETLADGVLSAGSHTLFFDGSLYSSGIYFARLEAGSVTRTQKLALLR